MIKTIRSIAKEWRRNGKWLKLVSVLLLVISFERNFLLEDDIIM